MQKGFTLIEFMIIIAILGILLAVAIPGYEDYQCKQTGNCSIESKQRVQQAKAKSGDVQCIGGYQFFGDKQIIGENGGGVKCTTGSYYESR